MNISPLILVLLGELLLITAVMSVFLMTGSLRRKSRDHVAALALIGQIKDKEESRLEETRALVGRIHGTSDTEADELAISIQNGELAHYQILVDSYIKRDAAAFRGVCESFEAATDPYRKMEHAQESTSDDVEVQIVDPGEFGILKEEKERLAEELKITMETMGRMLSEYACMYAGGAVEELDKESIANMYSADEAGFEEEEDGAIEDTALSGEPDADAATLSDDADIPELDQEWIEEAVKASESEASPDADSAADEDKMAVMDSAQLSDDLVSLDVESGKGG